VESSAGRFGIEEYAKPVDLWTPADTLIADSTAFCQSMLLGMMSGREPLPKVSSRRKVCCEGTPTDKKNLDVILHHNQTISQALLDPTFSISGRGSIFLNGFRVGGAGQAVPLLRETHLPAGPYFAIVRSGKLALYQAWRLHADTARACKDIQPKHAIFHAHSHILQSSMAQYLILGTFRPFQYSQQA
jgi:hypothetical protein